MGRRKDGLMMFTIDYNNVKVSDYLRLLAHYKLPNKRQRRLIENRFVCLNALFKKVGESSGN
ncbi:hypothetical protein COE94_00085 [Bacillus toyonensis]|nr:hypothetical protein COE94_00085 [Bacillus toyonensis]